jgi:hypothetical protein
MPDIYSAINQDHDSHRRILGRLFETLGDGAERRELYCTLRQEVATGAAAIERTLHARLMTEPASRKAARHADAAHADIAAIFDAMDAVAFSGPEWIAGFRALKAALDRRMDAEENTVFPLAQTLISDREAAALGARYEDLKSERRHAA